MTNDSPPVLSARSVVFSYGRTSALRGIGVEIDEGEIVAVTGPSGSGKSTLLLCLAGVLAPDDGSVRYRGQDLALLNDRQRSRLRRTRFGVLFQFGQLIPELSAADNVALPLLLAGRKRTAARALARTWMERFGVVELADTRPMEMSGGQAQRVAVARAMVTEPDVLFADEPTAALDALAGEEVLAQMVRVAREAGTTVVLVTHDATVAAYGDREIVVRDGTLVTASEGVSR